MIMNMFELIFGTTMYIVAVSIFTFIMTLFISIMWWCVGGQFEWIWQFHSGIAKGIILFICFVIANVMIADYIEYCERQDDKKNEEKSSDRSLTDSTGS